MPRRLLATSLAAGLIAITAQSLIIRELAIAFLGNELVIGVTLGAWLLWTGIGSATLGRLAERSRSPATWLAAELVLLAVFLPTCFLAATGIRTLIGLDPGEIAGPIPIVLSCLGVLAPLCLFNGSIFPALCRLTTEAIDRSSAIARVYVWEAIGATVGGVLFAFAIVRLGEPVLAVAGCSLVAMILAVVVRRKCLCHALIWAGPVVILAFGSALYGLTPREHINTIYGRTTVRKHEGTTSVFHNGMLSATFPLVGTAEPLVHTALLQVGKPERVLLIGGLAGSAEEALKYGRAHVDIVELDPDAAEFVRGLKPPSPALADAFDTGRARLIFQDGRRYVVRHRGRAYDAIILSLPQPVTAQVNRYYTVEFYRAAARILSDRGVLAFSVESAPNLSTPELRDFVACLRRTLAAVFADVVVTPGDYNIFVAGKRPGQLTLDADVLLDRLYAGHIRTQVFDSTVQGDLNPFKIAELRNILDESPSTQVNTDVHPISYSQGLAVWSAKERTPRSEWPQRLVDAPARWLGAFASLPRGIRWLIGLSVLVLAVAVVVVLRPSRGSAAAVAVASSGFTEITVEIIALLAFQALYGYVYAMLGLILASFMAGLCVGGLVASRLIRLGADSFQWLVRTQWILAAYPLVLVGAIWLGSVAGASEWPVVLTFLALTFVAGFTGGLQFPLATAVAGGAVAARFAALDLCGAAVGALAVSAYLIPALGFVTLGILLTGLGLVALSGLLTSGRRAG